LINTGVVMLRRFSTRLTVRVGDINYGGHLGNDKFLLYFYGLDFVLIMR
jgi:hypothetical protein